jgi:hypothetical protein
MMSIRLPLLCRATGIALVAFSSLVSADPASEAAYRLLDSIGAAESMRASIDGMLEVQLQQAPAMAPYRKVMREFFEEYMSYDSMKHDFVALYVELFTVEEMEALAAFNETPLGQKSIRLMPQIMARGAEIGIRRVQENQALLSEMIRAESERLQRLSE